MIVHIPVIAACLAAVVTHTASFYLGTHEQWKAFNDKLGGYRTTSRSYKHPNKHDENVDRIWLKRKDDWRQGWDARDRIWLKRRSEESGVSGVSSPHAIPTKRESLETYRNDVIDGTSFLRIKEDVEKLLKDEGSAVANEIKINDQRNTEDESEADSGAGLRYDVTLDSQGDLHLYWDIGKTFSFTHHMYKPQILLILYITS